MTIRIWQSYSCNNSTNFRLVARFADPMVAAEASAELAAFVAAHTKEVAETKNRRDESYAGLELADKYGLDPDQLAMYGNGDISEIEVGSEGEILVVYHHYSLGFGEAYQRYLEVRGAATVNRNASTLVELSVLFAYQPGDAALIAELDALIAQNDRETNTQFVTPWHPKGHWGRSAVFRDAGTAGVYASITPDDLPPIRAWLADRDLAASLRLCQPADFALFRALGAVRCGACGGLLTYLDPSIHDIEHPQLQCTPCGGLYELSAFEDLS